MGLTMRELCPEMNVPLRMETLQWFALVVKHQHERGVEQALRCSGIETCLPLYGERRRWSDRVKQQEAPLFPGYVFGRFDYRQRVVVLRAPGVARVVGFGGQPAPLEDSEIDDIRRALSSRLPLRPWPYLKPGDRVRLERGPLRGMEGRLLREKSGLRFIIGVELLQRSLAVEVESDMLGPC